jgi:methylated-DNA-protein-cysteine methyltransferase-like protein
MAARRRFPGETFSVPKGRRAERRGRAADANGPPPFYRLVYRVVRRIPRGKVATYGQIAAILGQPRGARAVGMALGALRDDAVETVPWQRVVGSAGRCTHRDGFAAGIQQEMLEAEGVAFDRRGHLDLGKVRWKGPRREWATSLRGEI